MTSEVDTRWKVTITYRSQNGTRLDTWHVQELCEIQDIVEFGPDWNALVDIRIVLARRTQPECFTVEDGAALCGSAIIATSNYLDEATAELRLNEPAPPSSERHRDKSCSPLS